MADASTIGASFSQYQGDPNLGGGGLGFGRIDTRPIQDLARYVFLYNKSEYDQRQIDAEKAAAEIADYMSYDLTSSIPKDRKIVEEKYSKLLDYIRENPGAINYRDKEKWREYQRLRSDLANDIKSGKIRSALNINREQEIADEKNEERKKLMRDELNRDIERTGIRDALPVTQQYDLTIPDLGVNKGMKFDVTKKGSNQIFQRDYIMFDRAEAMRSGAAVEMGFDAVDLGTMTGKLKQAGIKQNFWVRGKDLLNQAIQSTKKPDGTLDESKISGLALTLLTKIKEYNADTEKERNNIINGIYLDKLGNRVSFGTGNIREEHYAPINFQDGISAQELAVIAQYTLWPGDDYQTKVIQTNDALEKERIAVQWANYGLAKSRLDKSDTEDLIGADAVLREVTDKIKLGTPVMRMPKGEIGPATNAAGKLGATLISIADASLLREFSTIDKDGKTTNTPDAVFVDKKKNQLSLVYYERDPETGAQTDKIREEHPLNATEWIGKITQRKFPNKDIGGVNSLIDQVYNKFGRNLTNLANNYGGGATTTTGNKTETKLTTEQIEFKKKYGLE